MINLIPNQEKKDKTKDFYYRFFVVFLMAVGFCALIASVSILPAYVFSLINKNLANSKLESQKAEPVPVADQNSLAIVKDLDNKLKLIEDAEKNKYLISQKIINEILLQKMPDIKIHQINFENTVSDGKKVNIQGVAPNRERLLLFRLALEDSIAFEKVDLPISNFVKGSDIEFFLSLVPNSQNNLTKQVP